MKYVHPPYSAVKGKTYTLFGNSDSTKGYYGTIEYLANIIVSKHPDLPGLIDDLKRLSGKKRTLKRALKKITPATSTEEIVRMIDPELRIYTENVEQHLKTLPLSKFWDRRLATTRIQYHLYMLEIELTNRLFIKDFIKADRKIALMPYCLQDFSSNCKSDKNGFDYQCRSCSKNCFQNHASVILKAHGIEPYIWMQGDMKQLAKYTFNENRTFGVFGIACIPELTWGMRNCRKNHIPVVGIPLNANRCRRWFGRFYPNSIDLDELGRLLSNVQESATPGSGGY
jgi:hypothetical protein